MRGCLIPAMSPLQKLGNASRRGKLTFTALFWIRAILSAGCCCEESLEINLELYSLLSLLAYSNTVFDR